MKKAFWKGMMAALFCFASSTMASPLVVVSWEAAANSNTGTYADSNGSTVAFTIVDGKKDGKAISVKSDLKTGGWCGIWHTLTVGLGGAEALVFDAKSDKAGVVQIALKDTFNGQYVSTFSLPAGEWTKVTLPLASFQKDPYYTPPDAVAGKAMDFTTLKGMNFSPQVTGPSVLVIGSVTADQAGKADAAKPVKKDEAKNAKKDETKAVVADKKGVVVEGWETADSGNTGTYADTNGAVATFKIEDGPKKGKALRIEGELKPNGWMGVWHTVKADLSKAAFLRFQAKSNAAGEVTIALKDKTNNQYIAKCKVTTAWSEVLVPMSSFQKDPYYTPPDAIAGQAMDLSETKNMNFAPQTMGKVDLSIGAVEMVAAKK